MFCDRIEGLTYKLFGSTLFINTSGCAITGGTGGVTGIAAFFLIGEKKCLSLDSFFTGSLGGGGGGVLQVLRLNAHDEPFKC